MSDNRRSFWSSVPGLVTGLAGLLTGVVGLITLLVQLNVIGGDKSDTPKVTATTAVGGAPTTVGGSAGTVVRTQSASFTATPKLNFGPTDQKEKTVTVRNTGGTAELKVTDISLTGADKDRFAWSYGDCSTPLKANAVCNLNVTFSPSGPLKNYAATLQVNAGGAPTQQVELTASTIL